MEEKGPIYLEKVPQKDWERTPASVKKLVENMGQRIERLEKQQAEFLLVQQQLLEKVNSTSKNSSSPPSSDPPSLGKKLQKSKSGKKRGGQPGHEGKSRDLYPIEKCSEVISTETEIITQPFKKIPRLRQISPIEGCVIIYSHPLRASSNDMCLLWGVLKWRG